MQLSNENRRSAAFIFLGQFEQRLADDGVGRGLGHLAKLLGVGAGDVRVHRRANVRSRALFDRDGRNIQRCGDLSSASAC